MPLDSVHSAWPRHHHHHDNDDNDDDNNSRTRLDFRHVSTTTTTGTLSLRADFAPHPSSVIWENLGVSANNRRIRRTAVNVILMVQARNRVDE